MNKYMEDDKQFWEEFIELYRSYPCLWDVKSKAYSNRNTKNSALQILTDKCKEKYPSCDKNFVTKKINSMRGSFRRQNRKIMASKNQTCSAADDVVEPTLWYYHLLTFLLDQDEVWPCVSNKEEVHSEEEYNETNVIPSSPEASTSSTPSIRGNNKRKSISKDDQDWNTRRIQLADAMPTFINDEHLEDEWDVFGKSIGIQFKKIPPLQAAIAQKLMNDVMFYAKINQLTTSSSIKLQDQPSSEPSNPQLYTSYLQSNPSVSTPIKQSLFSTSHGQQYSGPSCTQFDSTNHSYTQSQLPPEKFTPTVHSSSILQNRLSIATQHGQTPPPSAPCKDQIHSAQNI